MAFKLSNRSLGRLEGINPKLHNVVTRGIELTRIDFGVTQGMRTIEQQKAYFEAGKSQTMKSKHLVGDAVDVVAYVGGDVSWDGKVYDDIADAFAQAAKEQGVAVKWGAAWSVGNIAAYGASMEDAMMEYIDLRRSQGRRPFIDAPHFELM